MNNIIKYHKLCIVIFSLLIIIGNQLIGADVSIGMSESDIIKHGKIEGKITIGTKSIYKFSDLIVKVDNGKVISIEKRNISEETKKTEELKKRAIKESIIQKDLQTQKNLAIKKSIEQENIQRKLDEEEKTRQVNNNNNNINNNSRNGESPFHIDDSKSPFRSGSCGTISGIGFDNESALSNATSRLPKDATQIGNPMYSIRYENSRRIVECVINYETK